MSAKERNELITVAINAIVEKARLEVNNNDLTIDERVEINTEAGKLIHELKGMEQDEPWDLFEWYEKEIGEWYEKEKAK